MLADITHNSVGHRQSTMETFPRWQGGKVANYHLLTCPPDMRTNLNKMSPYDIQKVDKFPWRR